GILSARNSSRLRSVLERRAAPVLEGRRAFVGEALRAPGLGPGEVVFNAAMTRYQEGVADPSYAGQRVWMTHPLQRNDGVTAGTAESARPWARAYIARWACETPSHHAATAPLDAYLAANGIPGIQGIDTRALTRHLRTHGALRAVLSTEDEAPSPARLEE